MSSDLVQMQSTGTREMAQQLRAFAAHAENPDLVPLALGQLTATHCSAARTPVSTRLYMKCTFIQASKAHRH